MVSIRDKKGYMRVLVYSCAALLQGGGVLLNYPMLNCPVLVAVTCGSGPARSHSKHTASCTYMYVYMYLYMYIFLSRHIHIYLRMCAYMFNRDDNQVQYRWRRNHGAL